MKAIDNLNTHAYTLVELAKLCEQLRPICKSEEEYGQRINAWVGQHAVAVRAAITYFGG